MIKNRLLCVVLVASIQCFGQNENDYLKRLFIQSGDTLPYRILYPQNYNPAKAYPVLFFLHGSGERGNDNQKQLTHGGKMFLTDSFRKHHPAIVIFPQCPANGTWSNVQMGVDENGKREFNYLTDGEPSKTMRLLLGLVDYAVAEHRVVKRKVYVMGLSMGGMGTFEIVRRKPRFFAAAVPICGGANPNIAALLRSTHWWIFHGEKDNVVDPKFSIAMHKAMLKEGVKTKLTLYPDTNHNSWDRAFAEPQLMRWMFSTKKNKTKK